MSRFVVTTTLLLALAAAQPAFAQEAESPYSERIWCIEGVESAHGLYMWNSTPVWNGEHAQGWLGWLPSTARRWGVVIGDRDSEWAGAARILDQGERFARTQFAGVAMGWC